MDEIGGDPGAPPLSGGWITLLDKGDRFLERVQSKIPYWEKLPFSPSLTARGLLLAFVGLLLLLILPPLVERLLRRMKRVEANFRGDMIPQSFGIVIVLWSGSMLALGAVLLPGLRENAMLWLVAILGFGILGLLDDLRGDKKIQGLRGHFQAALRERKITTGFVKAVGGGLLALWLGSRLFPTASGFPIGPRALFAALLIALSANAVNLLDLRPGRAGAVFLISALLLLFAALLSDTQIGLPLLLFVFLPALVVYERDARGKVMLGDAGSNPLGAALGLALLQYASTAILITAMLALIVLHLVAERSSLTRIIEANPLLYTLDRLTGVRAEKPGE